jgi:hypothetical protein
MYQNLLTSCIRDKSLMNLQSLQIMLFANLSIKIACCCINNDIRIIGNLKGHANDPIPPRLKSFGLRPNRTPCSLMRGSVPPSTGNVPPPPPPPPPAGGGGGAPRPKGRGAAAGARFVQSKSDVIGTRLNVNWHDRDRSNLLRYTQLHVAYVTASRITSIESLRGSS